MSLEFFGLFHSRMQPKINMSEKVLESLEVKFMDLSPYVLDVDHLAKITSWLSITFLEKKTLQNHRLKSDFGRKSRKICRPYLCDKTECF